MAEINGRVGWRTFVPTNNPLWDNLVSYYTGDNTSNDSKGTNNGTLVNGATYTTGKINNGFSLDGINDYVSFADNSWNYTGDFSMSFWIKPTNSLGYQYVIENFNYAGNFYGWMVLLTSNAIRFEIYTGTGGFGPLLPTDAYVNTGAWNHVAISRVGSTGTKIYINNVLRASDSNTINPVYHPTRNYSRFGAETIDGGANYYHYNGSLDEVGIWNKALTAAEVTELYNAGVGKQYVAPAPTSIITNGLVLNLDASNALSYPGTGTTWTDLSGGGNNCTLLNGVAYSSTNGGTMVLDGINDYVKINNVAGLDLGNEYTFSIWVKFNSYNTVLVGNEDWGPTYLMYIGNSSTIYTAGEGGGTSFSGANLTTNQWVCITVVRSVTSNTLYKNGVYIAVSSRSIKSSIVKGIGAYSNGSFPLNGNISSVNAYNRALSASEVLQNFDVAKNRFGL